MPGELEVWMAHFACVLVRLGSAITFIPLPGLRQVPFAFRASLAFLFAMILAPATMSPAGAGIRTLSDAAWNLPLEAVLGLAAGVAVGWIVELVTLGMQLISIQAGFSYASTIDPATQADSGVLLVAGQLAAGLTFVCLGWEREVLAAFALSLERTPPGTWHIRPEFAALAATWTASTVVLALRLALPVTAFLMLADISLALLGRTQPQMPLVNLALPVKMGATMVLLAWQTSALPGMLRHAIGGALEVLGRFGVPR